MSATAYRSRESSLEQDWARIVAIAHRDGSTPDPREIIRIAEPGARLAVAIRTVLAGAGIKEGLKTVIIDRESQRGVYQEEPELAGQGWYFPPGRGAEWELGPKGWQRMVELVAEMREAAGRRPDLVTVSMELPALMPTHRRS